MQHNSVSKYALTSNYNRDFFRIFLETYLPRVYDIVPALLSYIGVITGAFSVMIHVALIIAGVKAVLLSALFSSGLWVSGIIIRHFYIKSKTSFNFIEEIIYFLFSFTAMVWVWRFLEIRSGIVSRVIPEAASIIFTMTNSVEDVLSFSVTSLAENAVLFIIFLLPAVLLSWLVTRRSTNQKRIREIWIFVLSVFFFGFVAFKLYIHYYAWTIKPIVLPERWQSLIMAMLYIAPLWFYLQALLIGHSSIRRIFDKYKKI